MSARQLQSRVIGSAEIVVHLTARAKAVAGFWHGRQGRGLQAGEVKLSSLALLNGLDIVPAQVTPGVWGSVASAMMTPFFGQVVLAGPRLHRTATRTKCTTPGMNSNSAIYMPSVGL